VDVFRACDLALPAIQALSPYQPGKPISELERELGLSEIVKLASNENPLGPSPTVLRAIEQALPDISLYPDGNGFALKKALSQQLQVDSACITLGNGSNDVLDLVARVFLGPGRESIFSAYAFAVYPIATQAVGAKAQIAASQATDSDQPYGHDLNAMRALVNEQTSVIFIANPNNPTGTWVKNDALEAFLASVPNNVMVVLDEAYGEYISEADYPNAVAWLDQYPNLIITRTFSKAYGLAGLRIGYAISHPDVSDLLNRVRHPFNTNSLALVAAEAALNDQDYLDQSRQLNDQGMAQLTAAFQNIGLSWIPSVGNFVCVDVGDGRKVFDALLRQGVIVRPVEAYQLPQYIRVSIGTEPENQTFIRALKRVLADV
jgi:histidinol-phosphate aminotransferase